MGYMYDRLYILAAQVDGGNFTTSSPAQLWLRTYTDIVWKMYTALLKFVCEGIWNYYSYNS